MGWFFSDTVKTVIQLPVDQLFQLTNKKQISFEQWAKSIRIQNYIKSIKDATRNMLSADSIHRLHTFGESLTSQLPVRTIDTLLRICQYVYFSHQIGRKNKVPYKLYEGIKTIFDTTDLKNVGWFVSVPCKKTRRKQMTEFQNCIKTLTGTQLVTLFSLLLSSSNLQKEVVNHPTTSNQPTPTKPFTQPPQAQPQAQPQLNKPQVNKPQVQRQVNEPQPQAQPQLNKPQVNKPQVQRQVNEPQVNEPQVNKPQVNTQQAQSNKPQAQRRQVNTQQAQSNKPSVSSFIVPNSLTQLMQKRQRQKRQFQQKLGILRAERNKQIEESYNENPYGDQIKS